MITKEPREGGWIIEQNTIGSPAIPDEAVTCQNQFESEIKGKEWIKP